MKTTYLPRLTLLACAATLSAGAMAAGDPAAGKIKSFTCKGCHGVPSYNNVYPTYKVPKPWFKSTILALFLVALTMASTGIV